MGACRSICKGPPEPHNWTSMSAYLAGCKQTKTTLLPSDVFREHRIIKGSRPFLAPTTFDTLTGLHLTSDCRNFVPEQEYVKNPPSSSLSILTRDFFCWQNLEIPLMAPAMFLSQG